MQGQHGHLLVLPVGAGQLAGLAVAQDPVGAVPVLDDLQALVDLPSQCREPDIIGQEDRLDRPAQRDRGLVGGVLGARAG